MQLARSKRLKKYKKFTKSPKTYSFKQSNPLVLPLLDQADIEQALTLQIGEAKQELNFILDTGSSDCWVMSQECDLCQTFTDFNEIPINLYSTDAEIGDEVSIEQGSGGIHGYKTEDVVSFTNEDGDEGAQSFSLPFLVLNETDIESLNQSGLIGLGFNILKAYESKSFMDTIIESGLIDEKMFMFNMANTNQNDVVTTEGGIAFGEKAIKEVLGDDFDKLIWISLTEEMYWTTSFNNLSLGDSNSTGFKLNIENLDIIFDTGTSVNQMDPEIVDYLNLYMQTELTECGLADVMGENTMACVCSQTEYNNLSGMTATLNNNVVELPLESWLMYDKEDGVCINTISPANDGINILGDSFFKFYHVVFDQDNQQVGLLLKTRDESVKEIVRRQNKVRFYDLTMVVEMLVKSADGQLGEGQGSKYKKMFMIMMVILFSIVLIVQIVFSMMKRDKNHKIGLVDSEIEGTSYRDECLIKDYEYDYKYDMWK